jgi:hypothetical protein
MRRTPLRPTKLLSSTFAAAALVAACDREPTVAPAPTTESKPDPNEVPDDAFAIVAGTAIPRLQFDEAMAKLSAGGPASRDDRGLRQRVGVALVARETIRLELGRLGIDLAGATTKAAPLVAALERSGVATTPTWWAMPPMTSDELPAAVLVAADHVPAATDEEIAAQYDKDKAKWSGAGPWFRVETWSIAYDDAVGVEACDAYIAKYRRCIAKFPASTQPTVLADLSRQAAQWRSRIDEPDWRTLLETECEATQSEALASTAEMGCDWNTDAMAAERKAIAARRGELQKQARAAADRIAAGEEVAAVAASLGGVATPAELLTAADLSKPLAAAARKLGDGKASKPVDDGGAWTVVRVIQKHPKGALPLDAVKGDVAEALRIAKLAAALEDLPATLRGKYEVRLHDTVESLDEGPK